MECEIVCMRNLEKANCYEWMSENADMRTGTQDLKGKIVADNERHPNTSHLGGTRCKR